MNNTDEEQWYPIDLEFVAKVSSEVNVIEHFWEEISIPPKLRH